jgi:hypothetical protein
MADLTQADVGVTLIPQDVDFGGTKVVAYPTVTFGDGQKTIPAGGLIPLPPMGKFGMKREIKRLVVCGGGGSGYVFEYAAASHALLALMGNYDFTGDGPLIPAAGVAIPATTLPLMVVGE